MCAVSRHVRLYPLQVSEEEAEADGDMAHAVSVQQRQSCAGCTEPHILYRSQEPDLPEEDILLPADLFLLR